MPTDDTEGQWEGYSIYRKVSGENHDAVTAAIDAHAAIVSVQSEGASLSPEDAKEFKSALLGAAMRFLTELEREAARDREPFTEIRDAWVGDDGDGHLDKLRKTRLRTDNVVSDEWFRELPEQIHRVAWELGYIKAGRQSETTEEGSADDPAGEMTEDLAHAAS